MTSHVIGSTHCPVSVDYTGILEEFGLDTYNQICYTSSMQSVEKIKNYLRNDLNILLQGKHGTGKTTVLTQAANELGYSVAYYSASTMDPFADFVGIPIPKDRGDGTKILENIRPHRIDTAEVVIFDELNRADPKVLNAVLELVQFRSINGERLPKLKCVIAAQNPPEEGYNVDTLDEALVDRFDIMINVEPDITVAYLAGAIGDRKTAASFVNWWKQRSSMSDKAAYISPRRLEKMASLYMTFNKDFSVVIEALPPGNHDYGKLRDMLEEADDPAAVNRWYADRSDASAIRARDVDTLSNDIPNLTSDNRGKVVAALKTGLDAASLLPKYVDVFAQFTPDEMTSLAKEWGKSKAYRISRVYKQMDARYKDKIPNFLDHLPEYE